MGSLCHSLSDQPVIQQKNGMLCSTDMALMEILRSDRAFFFLSSYTFKHSYLDIGNHSTLEVSTGHSKIMPPMGLTLNLLVLPKELPCDMQSLEAYPKD